MGDCNLEQVLPTTLYHTSSAPLAPPTNTNTELCISLIRSFKATLYSEILILGAIDKHKYVEIRETKTKHQDINNVYSLFFETAAKRRGQDATR